MVDFKKMVDKSRLEKFVGMLGSDHDGEILNAVRFIRKIAEAQGQTISELLLSGPTRVVERVVYRDPPINPNPPPQSSYGRSKRFYDWEPDPSDPKNYTRTVLDALAAAAVAGDGILDFPDMDFARNVPFEFSYDHELTGRQLGKARAIIRKVKRNSAEPLI